MGVIQAVELANDTGSILSVLAKLVGRAVGLITAGDEIVPLFEFLERPLGRRLFHASYDSRTGPESWSEPGQTGNPGPRSLLPVACGSLERDRKSVE